MINFIPTIFEKNYKGVEYNYDIYSKFLKERIVFLNGNITEENSNLLIMQILYLDEKNYEDINIYINSNGGDIYSGLSIYDVMKYVKSDISTVCMGAACSMAAFILSCGTYGKRYAFSNSRIMIHQPTGGSHGQASDIKIHTKEILYLKKRINSIFSKNTGVNIKRIKKDTNRDYFMSSLDALNYGIIDHIILKK